MLQETLFKDLTPGMRLTIMGAAQRYNVSYETARQALRRLWHGEVLTRRKDGRVYVYEGKQGRLV